MIMRAPHLLRNLLSTLLVTLLFSLLSPAAAHEMRPAYLQIKHLPSGEATVVWKQPTLGEVGIRLLPRMSNGWLEATPEDQYAAGGYLVRVWRIPRAGPLDDVRVDIDGLRDTVTDVLVRVSRPDKPDFHAVVRPASPSLEIPGEGPALAQFDYLHLGFEHILTGYDHLLFVLGLLLIVPGRKALLITITAFTAAHSITLAISTITQVNLPVPLLETLITLSIVFLALEVIRRRDGGDSLALRKPWLVAFVFGLLHGMGFSTALTALDLGSTQLAGALLLFNLGVELGQLVFVAVVLAAWQLLRRTPLHRWQLIHHIPVYLIGCLGAWWTFENAFGLF